MQRGGRFTALIHLNQNLFGQCSLQKTPIEVPEDAELVITMYHKSRFTDHNVGNFKIHYTENTDVTLDGGSSMPVEVVNALKKEPNALKPEERKTVDRYFREKVPNPISIAKSNLEKSKKAKDTFMAKVPSTMIMKEKSAPKEAFILNRGEYDQPTKKFLGITCCFTTFTGGCIE